MSPGAFDSWASCRRPFVLHRCTRSMLIDLNQNWQSPPQFLILGEVNRLEQQASNRQNVLHHFCKESYKCSYFLKLFPSVSPRSALKDTMILQKAKTSGPITAVLGKRASVYWEGSECSLKPEVWIRPTRHGAGRWHSRVMDTNNYNQNHKSRQRCKVCCTERQ